MNGKQLGIPSSLIRAPSSGCSRRKTWGKGNELLGNCRCRGSECGEAREASWDPLFTAILVTAA